MISSPGRVPNSWILGFLIVSPDVLLKALGSRRVILSLFLRVQILENVAKFPGSAQPLVRPAATFGTHGKLRNPTSEWSSVSSSGAREPLRMLRWLSRPELLWAR